MPPISISSAGDASRSFSVGISVWPPATSFVAVGIVLQQIDRLGERCGADVVEGCGDHRLAPVRACWTAAQTRGGVIGMSRCLIPNGDKASSTA